MRDHLPEYLEEAVPAHSVNVMPQIQRKLARRRLQLAWSRVASAVAAVGLMVGAGLLWSHAPRPAADAQAVLARATMPATLTTLVTKGATADQTTDWVTWYAAPNRSRIEVSRDGQLESITQVDGPRVLEYLPQDRSLLIRGMADPNESLTKVFASHDLSGVLKRAGECYSPKVTGTEAVGSRSAYVVVLGAPHCDKPQDLEERILWIDQETYVVLKAATEAREVTYNPAIPREQLELTIPVGTLITNLQEGRDPVTASLASRLAELGRPAGFPLFFAQSVPAGMEPTAPVLTPAGYEFAYTGGGKSAQVIQRNAYSSDVAREMPDQEPVTLGRRTGWFIPGKQLPGGGVMASTLKLIRDGTYISITSYDLTREELLQIAASLREVPQDRPLDRTNPRALSVDELRHKVGFPVFALKVAEAGLVLGKPYGGDGLDLTVKVPYTDGKQEQLLVLSGPAGCCLDADPRKVGQTVLLRRGSVSDGGIQAHFLPGLPETGGPILWWVEGHAYVAVSGPHLTRERLVEIAEALSSH